MEQGIIPRYSWYSFKLILSWDGLGATLDQDGVFL